MSAPAATELAGLVYGDDATEVHIYYGGPLRAVLNLFGRPVIALCGEDVTDHREVDQADGPPCPRCAELDR